MLGPGVGPVRNRLATSNDPQLLAVGYGYPWLHTLLERTTGVDFDETQIARVVPVYTEILRRYPTIDAMAAAPLDAVTAVTDPLGYKVRGRTTYSEAPPAPGSQRRLSRA